VLSVTYKHFMLCFVLQNVVMLSVVMLSVVKLSVVMQSVIMQSVVMQSVVMLSVVGPNKLECYITSDWRGLSWTNTLAYWHHMKVLKKKKC
jgi:hypothetical protein